MTPAFYSSGGDIVWSGNPGKPLSADDVTHFHTLFREEAWAAFHAGDDADYERCASLLQEIVDARKEQARWVRCGQIRRAA